MPQPEPTSSEPILPDLLAPGLDVIFVGAAPSHSAAAIGHYYAGPTNKFWLLLYQAGFTPRRLRAEEDSEVLRYGIGLTGLFKHTSTSANHLLPPPSESLRERLRAKLLANAPRYVCYNSKDVYQRLPPYRGYCRSGVKNTFQTNRLCSDASAASIAAFRNRASSNYDHRTSACGTGNRTSAILRFATAFA